MTSTVEREILDITLEKQGVKTQKYVGSVEYRVAFTYP